MYYSLPFLTEGPIHSVSTNRGPFVSLTKNPMY